MNNTRPLLTIDGNPKIAKGDKKGQYWTAILHLAPHTQAGGINMCPSSTPGCRLLCLTKAGRGGMINPLTGTNNIQIARVRKTKEYLNDRVEFVRRIMVEVGKFETKAKQRGLQAAVRLNGTSDQLFEKILVDGKCIMEHFPNVIFYDYTKIAGRKDLPSNYSLTFSLAENNEAKSCVALNSGMNVAVVFSTKKGKHLPASYSIGGKEWKVIDGDETDLRFTDPKGVIVGLRAKGNLAKKDKTSGFVRQVD